MGYLSRLFEATEEQNRQAILSLIIFFVAGAIILYFTDTDKAIHEAGNRLPDEAAASPLNEGT